MSETSKGRLAELGAEEIAAKVVARERRLTMQLMGHWRGLRGARRAPLARDFRDSVPPDLLADCFIFRVSRSRLEEIGDTLARRSRIKGKSHALSSVPGDTLLGVASRWLQRVVEQGAPVVDEGEFADPDGKPNLYRAILLPLENTQGRIVQVLGGARCKARPEPG